MESPGIENRPVGSFSGNGEMVFQTGKRVPVKYEIQVWREYSYGHPLEPSFEVRISSKSDPLFGMRYVGKQFTLETNDGKSLELKITNQDGAVVHCPGVVRGFPGIKDHA